MRTTTSFTVLDYIPDPLRALASKLAAEVAGLVLIAGSGALALALVTWSVQDPSLNHASSGPIHNLLGAPGAIIADLIMQMFGLAAIPFLLPIAFWGWRLLREHTIERVGLRVIFWLIGCLSTAAFAGVLPVTSRWPLPTGLGGVLGDALLAIPRKLMGGHGIAMAIVAGIFALIALLTLSASVNPRASEDDALDDEEDALP